MINGKIESIFEESHDFTEFLKKLELLLQEELEIESLSVFLCSSNTVKNDPEKGIIAQSCMENKAYVLSDLSEEKRFDPASDNPQNLKITSILTYPLEYKEKKMAIVVAWGRENYSVQEERLVPLKSGSETIGVTVVKDHIEHSERVLTQSDIEKLTLLLEGLSKTMYQRFFLEEEAPTNEKDDSELKRESLQDAEIKNEEKKDPSIQTSWFKKIKEAIFRRN